MDNGDENSRSCLTKADLAEAIFASMPIDKQRAADIVEDFIELTKDALAKEGKVMISGFGSYEVRAKKARKGRNPQTRESIILRARKVVKFRPSALLRQAINGETETAHEDDL